MKKIFTLFCLSALSVCIFAQWSTNPAENNAISVMAGDQTMPKTGLCSDGNIYIGFQSNETGFYNVRLQKLDPYGNELWPSNGILVFTDSTDGYTTDWELAIDAYDNAIMVFTKIENGYWEIVAYSISSNGTFNWGTDGVTLSNSPEQDMSPTVICTSAGNSVFAWIVDFNFIQMQKLNQYGQKQWGNEGISIVSDERTSWPVLLPVGEDDFILKYFDDSGDFTFPLRKIMAQRFDSNGNPVWPSPARISDAGGMASFNSRVSMISDRNDGFFIAWDDDRDDDQIESAFVQHINSSGQKVFSQNGIEVSTFNIYNHYEPCLAYPQGSNDVFVFWKEYYEAQNFISQEGITAQKISSTGARLWSDYGKTMVPMTEFITLLNWDADQTPEDLLFIFSAGGVQNDQAQVIYLDTDGNFLWPEQILNFSCVPSDKVFPDITRLSDNLWLATWSDFRNHDGDIYAQTFSLQGTVGPPPTYGNIQGTVTLMGGNGNVTDVVISAGNTSTFPDPSGDYVLNVETGTYTVTATLNLYFPDSVQNVIVHENQTTNNIDLELAPQPPTGYIEGLVTVAEGPGLVTDVTIMAGGASTHPDNNGYYMLETEIGTVYVHANLEGYTPLTLAARKVTTPPSLMISH